MSLNLFSLLLFILRLFTTFPAFITAITISTVAAFPAATFLMLFIVLFVLTIHHLGLDRLRRCIPWLHGLIHHLGLLSCCHHRLLRNRHAWLLHHARLHHSRLHHSWLLHGWLRHCMWILHTWLHHTWLHHARLLHTSRHPWIEWLLIDNLRLYRLLVDQLLLIHIVWVILDICLRSLTSICVLKSWLSLWSLW